MVQEKQGETQGATPKTCSMVIASLRGAVAALPVEQVSWFDAVEFVNARSRQAGLAPAYTISASGAACVVTPAKRH